MGEALSIRIVNVFMNRVTKQLTVGELSAGQVLGHAIVHEIGHHLLGDNSHAPQGIMVAKWSDQHLRRISKGDLLFTQQEVKRIQDEVKHRSRSAVRVAD
jgi:alcohol dehydrogenase class IV